VEPPDPRKSFFIFTSGKKGWGKSHYCRSWFDGYPFDRLVIDVTGDISDDFRAEGVPYTKLDPDVLPVTFPRSLDEDHPFVTCVYIPDMGSATAVDDMDRACGLVLRGKNQKAMLWVDEFGAITRANKTPPNMRRILHHGRHHNLCLLLACPRPRDVDTLGIAQADLVVTGRTPNVYDRETIANNIGYDVGEFSAINEQLHGHEHTAYDATGDQLYVMPPLPARRAGRNLYPPVPG
jgi:hypothetical protein